MAKTLGEIIDAELTAQSREVFWQAVVRLMRQHQINLEAAIHVFRTEYIQAEIDQEEDLELAACLSEEFVLAAQWMRAKFKQMRELIALADLPS